METRRLLFILSCTIASTFCNQAHAELPSDQTGYNKDLAEFNRLVDDRILELETLLSDTNKSPTPLILRIGTFQSNYLGKDISSYDFKLHNISSKELASVIGKLLERKHTSIIGWSFARGINPYIFREYSQTERTKYMELLVQSATEFSPVLDNPEWFEDGSDMNTKDLVNTINVSQLYVNAIKAAPSLIGEDSLPILCEQINPPHKNKAENVAYLALRTAPCSSDEVIDSLVSIITGDSHVLRKKSALECLDNRCHQNDKTKKVLIDILTGKLPIEHTKDFYPRVEAANILATYGYSVFYSLEAIANDGDEVVNRLIAIVWSKVEGKEAKLKLDSLADSGTENVKKVALMALANR